MTRALARILKEKDIPVREGVSAATLSTFRIGGNVALLVEPRTLTELQETIEACQKSRAPFAILGKGSNVLFADEPITTVLIRTVNLNRYRETERGFAAQCGVSLPLLSLHAARRGLGGLTFACGIPGTLGGALVMNAGAYGECLCGVVKGVSALDVDTNEIKTLLPHELNSSYRYTVFQDKKYVALEVELVLRKGEDPEGLLQDIREKKAQRSRSQPLELPSAGSSFRRPSEELPVGKILEELGLKGLRCGNAAVSQKHAGFIVNLGGATAADVRSLIAQIQKITERERGISLIPEICFIPFEQ